MTARLSARLPATLLAAEASAPRAAFSFQKCRPPQLPAQESDGTSAVNSKAMRPRSAILAGILLAACLPLRAQIPAPGVFSTVVRCSRSTCVWVPYNTHKTFHRGPYAYHVKAAQRGGTFYLRRGNRTIFQTRLHNLSASVSVSWAPGNSGFSITWSHGGVTGRYQAKAFLIRNGKVIEVPAASRAWPDFLAHNPCSSRPAENNLQVYHWVNAHDLLLVTSVFPNIFCGDQSGQTQGYIVRARTGAILRHLTPRQLTAYTDKHPQ